MSTPTSPADLWLPSNAQLDRTGVHLTFKVHGGLVAKQFSITAKVSGSNVSKLHQSKLQFFLGQQDQMEDFEYSKKTFEDSDNVFGRATKAYVMSWTTYGGYGTGLEVAEDYDEDAVATLMRMKFLSRGVRTEMTRIILMVADVPGLSEELQALQAKLIKYQAPWFPYLDDRGAPACSWAAFPKRVDVKAHCGGLVPVPAQNSFTTVTEACVILANGICLEYRVSPKNDPRAAWPDTEEDQTYLKTQLLALKSLCADAAGGDWWPVMLNQSVADLSIYDPLESVQASQNVIRDLWQAMEIGFPWDNHQKETLRTARKLRGRVGLIEGGPGSGKTIILAGIAVAYAYSGCPVLLFAPGISQAKALSQAVARVLSRVQSSSLDQTLRPYARRLNILRFYPDETNLKEIARFPAGFAKTMKEADIVVALPYAICSQALTTYFGAHSEHFIVMHDDAHQLTESQIWGTIFSLSSNAKCKGLIMSTDVKEWPLGIATLAPFQKKCVIKKHRHYQQEFPWMFSTYLKCAEENRALPGPFQTTDACKFEYSGGINEFADQTGLALVSRLLRQGFPSVMLRDQHRLKAALTTVPNKLVYKTNPLGSVQAPFLAPDIKRCHDMLRKWLGVKLDAGTEGKDMSVIFVEASYGKDVCIKERNTTNSKRNHRNVDVVYDLVTKNHQAKALNARDIKIVTQYKDQVRLYNREFDNRAKNGGIPKRSLPEPITLDTLRGQQAKVVIYDLVVTCGDQEHGLGIINNEFRACLAATRATDTLIIVGSRELVTTFPDFWKWMNRRTGAFDNPLPLIVRYAKFLRDAGLSFEPATDERDMCDFPLQDAWFRTGSGFLEWESNRNNDSGERE